jgi:hypothetical protein
LGGTRFDIVGFGAPPTKEDFQYDIRKNFHHAAPSLWRTAIEENYCKPLVRYIQRMRYGNFQIIFPSESPRQLDTGIFIRQAHRSSVRVLEIDRPGRVKRLSSPSGWHPGMK